MSGRWGEGIQVKCTSKCEDPARGCTGNPWGEKRGRAERVFEVPGIPFGHSAQGSREPWKALEQESDMVNLSTKATERGWTGGAGLGQGDQ